MWDSCSAGKTPIMPQPLMGPAHTYTQPHTVWALMFLLRASGGLVAVFLGTHATVQLMCAHAAPELLLKTRTPFLVFINCCWTSHLMAFVRKAYYLFGVWLLCQEIVADLAEVSGNVSYC